MNNLSAYFVIVFWLYVHHIFLECYNTLPARNLLFNNVQTMQDLFTQVIISDILQFLQKCDFYNFYTYIFYIFMPVGWDVKWCPVSRTITPLTRKRFRWRVGSWGPPGKHWSHFTNSPRRYMAEILPIRRKTLSNQS